MTFSEGATLAGAIVAGAGVWVIVLQLNAYKRFSKSQMISELVRDFEPHLEVQGRLMSGNLFAEKPGSCDSLDREMWLRIFSYLGFFEKIYFLVKNEAVRAESIAELFLYRFLIVLHHIEVQDRILYDDLYGPRFVSVVRLHQQVLAALERKGRVVPDIGRSLQYDRCPGLYDLEWPMSV